MLAYHSDAFTFPLPEAHRFPATKYALLRKHVAQHLVPPVELCVAAPATIEELRRAHSDDYVNRVCDGKLDARAMRRIGLPWSPELVVRSLHSVGGTLAACRAALAEGVAVNLAGGTHHAFADRGEGFCIFNDVAVAVRAMQAEGRAQRIAVIDCDVHQGNGTAAIFAGDASIFTFSIHGAKNFPFHKERSDLDVELPDCADDALYLAGLEEGLAGVAAWGRADLVLYLAGADPFRGDSLGRLAVSKAGLAARDARVFAFCETLAAPVAVVMAGGYARPITDTVAIHAETVRLAARAAPSGP